MMGFPNMFIISGNIVPNLLLKSKTSKEKLACAIDIPFEFTYDCSAMSTNDTQVWLPILPLETRRILNSRMSLN